MRRLFLLMGVLWLFTLATVAQLPPANPASQSGDILISGSEVLTPLTENIATLYTLEGFSGVVNVLPEPTANALSAFCSGSIDIVMADRLITPEETAICNASGIVPIAFRVATDALVIAVGSQNAFITDLNTPELQAVFSTALNWSDVRSGLPNEPITRYLFPVESSPIQFFTSAVFGGDSGRILTATNNMISSDSSLLLQGLQSNSNAIAILSASIANRNSSLIRYVILNGVTPTTQAVTQNQYTLSRPLVLYTSAKTFTEKPQVSDFMNYYLANVTAEVSPLGLYPAGDSNLSQSISSWFNASSGITGQAPVVTATESPAQATNLVTETPSVTVISAESTQAPSEPSPPTLNETALLLLIDARNDLDLLAVQVFGIARPEGWSGSLDTENPQLALLIRLDLEIMAGSQLGADKRPIGWFGAVPSTSYAIARDVRHDLELLADALLGANNRPTGWQGADPLLRCSRATQALVNMLQRGGVYQVQVAPTDPNYCAKAEIEATQFSEVNLLNSPAEQAIFSAQTQVSLPGAITIQTNFAVGFLDKGAALKLGVVPAGTPLTAVARSFTRFSNMTLFRGEDFLVFLDYQDTSLTEEQWRTLPNVDSITETTFCNSEWCRAD